VYPASAEADSPIVIAAGIVTEHAAPPAPQLIPAPWTRPPAGTGEMVSVYGGPSTGAGGGSPPPAGVNAAPHVRAPLSASHRPGDVPAQSPVHPLKVYPASAEADSPIVIAAGIVTEHAAPPAPQLIPAPWTRPPAGTGEMVSVYGGPSSPAAAPAPAPIPPVDARRKSRIATAPA